MCTLYEYSICAETRIRTREERFEKTQFARAKKALLDLLHYEIWMNPAHLIREIQNSFWAYAI